MAGFTITKVIREHIPVEQSTSGKSYGLLLDQLLIKAAESGEEIQSFALELAPEEWRDFASFTIAGGEPVEGYLHSEAVAEAMPYSKAKPSKRGY